MSKNTFFECCLIFRKDDIRLESVKALRAVANAEDSMEKAEKKDTEVLPDFVSMINFVQEKVTGLQDSCAVDGVTL